MNTELLKQTIHSIINEDSTGATLNLHAYLVEKLKLLSESTDPNSFEKTNLIDEEYIVMN